MPTLARPEVDLLEGLTTAISVDQERMGGNPRSAVGTATDPNAMLRVLWSRLGNPQGFSLHADVAVVLRQYRVRPGLMDVRGRLVEGSRRWRPRTRPGCQRRLAVGGARWHAISGLRRAARRTENGSRLVAGDWLRLITPRVGRSGDAGRPLRESG